jgi:hypothetical protein
VSLQRLLQQTLGAMQSRFGRALGERESMSRLGGRQAIDFAEDEHTAIAGG